jgi:hypothetical protein
MIALVEEGPMVFIAYYSDGSCGIAEAENEENARKLLRSEEAYFTPPEDRLVSVRRLSSPFVSRWFFDYSNSENPTEGARLCGVLGERVANEILLKAA